MVAKLGSRGRDSAHALARAKEPNSELRASERCSKTESRGRDSTRTFVQAKQRTQSERASERCSKTRMLQRSVASLPPEAHARTQRQSASFLRTLIRFHRLSFLSFFLPDLKRARRSSDKCLLRLIMSMPPPINSFRIITGLAFTRRARGR